MKSTILRSLAFSLFVTTAGLSPAQSDPGGELGLRSEITGSGPAGRLVLTHTVWNPGTEVATNVWLTNQLPTGVSFHATNKWPLGSPGPTYPEPPPPPMFRAPIASVTTFDLPITDTNPPAVAIAIHDLDGDVWSDLVVAHGTNAGHITLVRATDGCLTCGGGTGNTNAVNTNLPVPHGSRQVAIGDLDGDGIPDIVSLDAAGNGLSTFLQAGGAPNGTNFVAGPTHDFSSPITAMAVMDFDGDGYDDLAVLEPATAAVHVLKSTFGAGVPGFTEVGTLITPPAPTAMGKEKKRPGRESPSLASLGRLFVVSDTNGGTLSVFLPSGQNTNLAELYLPRADYGCGATPRALAVGDLDGDGMEDLAVANGPARTVTLLRGNSNATYTAVGSKSCDASGNVIALHLLDLDGDGRPEIITGSGGQPDCIVLPNSRTGSSLTTDQFGAPVHFALPAPFRNLGFDTSRDGSQAGGFIVIGHSGPGLGPIPGGQSFTVLGLTQPGVTLAVPLGDLEPGEATGVSLDLEVRVPDATNSAFARAIGGGGATDPRRDKIPLRVICGAVYCISGGLTQGMGGFGVSVVLSGTGYYFSNSTVTLSDGSYCLDLPFSCGGVFPWDTGITVTTPACPGQVWTFPVGVLFASMTIPPVYCSNCTACTNVQNAMSLFSGSGSSGLLTVGSLDPQFTTGNPPFANANPYVTTASGGWLANGPSSQWVGPDPTFQSFAGVYCYTNAFYLPCTNSARLLGQWTVAGEGGVLLNGVPTGNTLGLGSEGSWSPLVLASGFVPGWNTLVFCVTNPPSSSGLPTSPTGLRVELTGKATCCTGCAEIHCPKDVVAEICTNGPAPHGQVVNYPAPAAFSHCGLITNVVCLLPAGSFFPLGTNLVTCTATDSLGNAAACSFNVIVRPDFTPPMVLQCPPLNVSVTGCPPVVPNFTTNVLAVDNCSGPAQITVTQSIPPGTPLVAGQAVVIVHICDAAGNCRDCDVIITAISTSGNPTIACPPNQVLLTCGTNAIGTYKTAVTGQNGPVVCTPPSGSALPLGVTWVTCTATNNCGGIATCSFSITVKPPPPRWPCPPKQLGIGIPFVLVGDATAAVRPGGGPGSPAICIFPNPAIPASGILLQPGPAQAITFTTVLDFEAPVGSGFELALPPDPMHPGAPPILSLRSKGTKGYCVKMNKRFADEESGVLRAYAVNTNGQLLDSLSFTAAEIQATGVFDILSQPGVTNCHVTVELDCQNGSMSVEFTGPIALSSERKGWDGCIYGPDRPVKKPASRVTLIPPVAPGQPPIAELYLYASGWPEVPIEEPSLTARGGRRWSDGHVTLMKAYDDGAEQGVEFVSLGDGGGVTVELGNAAGFECRFQHFENGDVPSPEQLFRIGGPRFPPGTTTNRPPPPVFDLRLVSASDGVECSIDFSPLAATAVTVELWNRGVFIGSGTGDGPAIRPDFPVVIDRWPQRMSATASNCVLTLTSSEGFIVTGALGDELRFIPRLPIGVPPPSSFSGLGCASSEGLESLITDLQRTPACGPAELRIRRTDDGTAVEWAETGYRLEGAEGVTGPWFDLGVISPAALPAGARARFFRLVCE